MKFDDLSREMVIELKQAYLLQRYWRKNKSISGNELETNADSLMSDDEIRALVGDCEFNEKNFCVAQDQGIVNSINAMNGVNSVYGILRYNFTI